MKQQSVSDARTSAHVLKVKNDDVPVFIRDCLKSRSLNKVVANLNNDLLFGTPTEQAEARRALRHIGFI